MKLNHGEHEGNTEAMQMGRDCREPLRQLPPRGIVKNRKKSFTNEHCRMGVAMGRRGSATTSAVMLAPCFSVFSVVKKSSNHGEHEGNTELAKPEAWAMQMGRDCREPLRQLPPRGIVKNRKKSFTNELCRMGVAMGRRGLATTSAVMLAMPLAWSTPSFLHATPKLA